MTYKDKESAQKYEDLALAKSDCNDPHKKSFGRGKHRGKHAGAFGNRYDHFRKVTKMVRLPNASDEPHRSSQNAT